MGQAGRIVVMQACIGGLCVVTFYLIAPAQGRSALLALASAVIPCLYYAWVQQRLFSAPRLLLHGVLRMALTGTLLVVSIVLAGIEPLGFFATFALVQLGYLAR